MKNFIPYALCSMRVKFVALPHALCPMRFFVFVRYALCAMLILLVLMLSAEGVRAQGILQGPKRLLGNRIRFLYDQIKGRLWKCYKNNHELSYRTP